MSTTTNPAESAQNVKFVFSFTTQPTATNTISLYTAAPIPTTSYLITPTAVSDGGLNSSLSQQFRVVEHTLSDGKVERSLYFARGSTYLSSGVVSLTFDVPWTLVDRPTCAIFNGVAGGLIGGAHISGVPGTIRLNLNMTSFSGIAPNSLITSTYST